MGSRPEIIAQELLKVVARHLESTKLLHTGERVTVHITATTRAGNKFSSAKASSGFKSGGALQWRFNPTEEPISDKDWIYLLSFPIPPCARNVLESLREVDNQPTAECKIGRRGNINLLNGFLAQHEIPFRVMSTQRGKRGGSGPSRPFKLYHVV